MNRSQYYSKPSDSFAFLGVFPGHLPALPLPLQGPLSPFLTRHKVYLESGEGERQRSKKQLAMALWTQVHTEANVLLSLTALG